jgi:hypothetical protein
MRKPSPVQVMLASGVLALVSLYLPWQQADHGSGPSAGGLLNTFGHREIDGWSTVGDALALSALLLVAVSLLALLRPALEARLPLGQTAVGAAFFVAAVVAQTHHDAHQLPWGVEADFRLAYGTVVGVAAGLAALAAAAALRREQLRSSVAREWPALPGGLVLLAALLLPWKQGEGDARIEMLGVVLAPGIVAALLTVRLLAARSGEALALAAGALVFSGGASVADVPLTRRYGAWLGLAAAGALVAATLARRRHVPLRLLPAVPAVALVVLGASLFAPWQRACYPEGDLAELGISGRCLTTNGWSLPLSVGLLVALCLVAVLASAARTPSRIELAAALALLVATAGFQLETATQGGVDLDIAYGALGGFAATAVLVAVALAGVRVGALDATARRMAGAGAALGALYVAGVLVPSWDVVSSGLWSPFSNGLAPLSWLTLAAALTAVRLTGRWVARLSGEPPDIDELVVLPLALSALVALDVLRYGLDDATWNTALIAVVAAALVVLGLVERAGGFGRVHVPELLRLDRL